MSAPDLGDEFLDLMLNLMPQMMRIWEYWKGKRVYSVHGKNVNYSGPEISEEDSQ